MISARKRKAEEKERLYFTGIADQVSLWSANIIKSGVHIYVVMASSDGRP